VERFSDTLPTPADVLPGAAFERDPTVDYQIHKAALYTMTTCHSLRLVEGELVGDPLDIKMFEFTGWSFEESARKISAIDFEELDDIPTSIARPPAGLTYGIDDPMSFTLVCTSAHIMPQPNHTQNTPIELRILKIFEFVSHLRRASVIVRQTGDLGGDIYVKGAPECMKDICNPESCNFVYPAPMTPG